LSQNRLRKKTPHTTQVGGWEGLHHFRPGGGWGSLERNARELKEVPMDSAVVRKLRGKNC